MPKLILTLTFLCALCLQALAQDESVEQIHAKAVELISAGKCQEAGNLLDKIHEMNLRADFKAFYLSLSGILYEDSLKNRAKATEYFNRSESCYPQIIQMTEGPINIGVTYSSERLAQYAKEKNLYLEAIDHYNQAITLLNHMQMNGIYANGMKPMDLQNCINSFKMGRAQALYYNKQEEDAELAFNELKYSMAQMQHSTDSDIVVEGYQIDLILQEVIVETFLKNPADKDKAYKAAYQLVEKLNKCLYGGDKNVSAALQWMAPKYLLTACKTYAKCGKYKEALELTEQAQAMQEADSWLAHILNARGEVYLAAGQVNNAKSCWAQTKIYDPAFFSNSKGKMPLKDKFGE